MTSLAMFYSISNIRPYKLKLILAVTAIIGDIGDIKLQARASFKEVKLKTLQSSKQPVEKIINSATNINKYIRLTTVYRLCII